MIVGEAHIVVRAITTSVKKDIEDAFNGIDRVGDKAGRDLSDGIDRGMQKNANNKTFSKWMQSLEKSTTSARKEFDALLVSSYSLGPAIAQLVAGISSLVGALGALAGMAVAALPSIAALGGAFVALLQGALTLKLAFSGVAAAIQAGTKAQKAHAAGTVKAKKDLTNYIRAVKDARRELARVISDNYDRIYEATKSVMEAEDALVRTEEEDAKKVADAKSKVEQAQLDLNDAYEKGAEAIQQLNFDAEDAALGEKRAALELDKARETLLRVQDLPPNSRARKEAELAYAQADLNYRKAIDSNKDAGKAADKANAAGVDGTKEVVDAKKSLYNAQQDLSDAETQSQQDRIDGLAKISDAEDALAKTQQDNNRRLADAQLRLARAQEDLAKARKKAAVAGTTADNAYKNAMADLSKQQQEFVRFMVNDFMPAIKKLKAAAASEFFPKLIVAMTTIKDKLFPQLEPLLAATGGKLGKIAEDIANRITSPKALGQIKSIWSTNDGVIQDFGKVVNNMLSAVLSLMQAIEPLTKRFSGWMVDASKSINDFFNPTGGGKKGNGKNAFTERQDQLKKFFKTSGDIMAEFGVIFGNVFKALGNVILELMKPGSGGFMLMNYFRSLSREFLGFTQTAKGKNTIAEYFKDVARNAMKIMDATGPILKFLLKMGTDKSVGTFADTIKGITPYLESIATKFLSAGPALAGFVVSFAKFMDLSMDSGAIKTFWGTLTSISDALITLFSNPTIQKGFIIFAKTAATLVALRTAFEVMKIPALAVLNPLIQIGKAGGKMAETLNPKAVGDVKAFMSLFSSEGLPALAFLPEVLGAVAAAAAPVLAVVAAVAALAAIFYLMWQNSENLRNGLKNLIDNVVKRAQDIFERLKKKLDEALKPLGGIKGLTEKLAGVFKWLGDVIAKYVLPFFEVYLKGALEVIGAIFGTIIDTIGNVISAFMGIIDAVKAGDWSGVFQNIVLLITAPFRALGSNLVDLVKNIFNDIVDAVKNVLGIHSPSQVFIDIAKAIIAGLINTLLFLPKQFLQIFINALGLVTGWWDKTGKQFFADLPGKIANLVKTLWDFWWKPLGIVWGKVTGWWTTTVMPWFGKIAGWALNVGGKVFDFFSTSISNAWKNVQSTWTTITTTIGGWVTTFKSKFSGLWDGLFDGLRAVWSGLKTWWNANVKGKGFEVGGWGPVPKFTFKIPGLATGGIVMPSPGGTLARIAEAGRPERVEPLDKDGLSRRDKAMIQLLAGGGSGGATFNIYAQPGMDVHELAKLVNREMAFQMRRGAA